MAVVVMEVEAVTVVVAWAAVAWAVEGAAAEADQVVIAATAEEAEVVMDRAEDVEVSAEVTKVAATRESRITRAIGKTTSPINQSLKSNNSRLLRRQQLHQQ
jgi:hypothetical protein